MRKIYSNYCFYCRQKVKTEDKITFHDNFSSLTFCRHYYCNVPIDKNWPSEQWCNQQDIIEQHMYDEQFGKRYLEYLYNN